MNRKDIIIISVLINAALLAVLFITATHPDDEGPPRPQPQVRTAMNAPAPKQVETEAPITIPQPDLEPYLAEAQLPMDEVDHVLRDYVPEEGLPLESNRQESLLPENPPEPQKLPHQLPPQNYVEVTVKKGDMLEKIARANGTTVQAIKDANKMSTDKLRIGQVLKVPTSGGDKIAETPKPATTSAPVSDGDPVYYIVKSGDNPWKIAKQFNVKFEDILKLNGMSEEQARKLKVGDKIRVK